jgi:hypothetical protein
MNPVHTGNPTTLFAKPTKRSAVAQARWSGYVFSGRVNNLLVRLTYLKAPYLRYKKN